MTQEIFSKSDSFADKLIEDNAKELMNDPDFRDSIMKVGAKTLSAMMFVAGIDIEGFSVEHTVAIGNGQEFTIEVGRATNE